MTWTTDDLLEKAAKRDMEFNKDIDTIERNFIVFEKFLKEYKNKYNKDFCLPNGDYSVEIRFYNEARKFADSLTLYFYPHKECEIVHFRRYMDGHSEEGYWFKLKDGCSLKTYEKIGIDNIVTCAFPRHFTKPILTLLEKLFNSI
jgi:hypothetical protein